MDPDSLLPLSRTITRPDLLRNANVMNTKPESTEPSPDASTPASAPEENSPASSPEVVVEESTVTPEASEVTMEATSEASEEAKSEPSSDKPEAAKIEDPASDTGASTTTDAAAKEAMGEAVESDTRLEHKLKKGQKVEVKLVQAGEKDAFLDWGGPAEGTIATAELKNEAGELRVEAGQTFTALVRELGDTVVFTVGRGKGGDLLRMRELESAHEAKLPVAGKIRSTNKGGFEVDLNGVRAFCPFSQIDTIYCDTPEDHVGRQYDFEIITFERGGRNIVVSRRGLLEASQKGEADETRKSIEIGQVRTGKVRRIQPYGAFVDVGGLDGLVHVSEISRAHIRNPKDVLKVGQEIEVKVVGLDGLGTKKERVSLSMKALAPDPWDGAAENWKQGSTVKGKVVRLTDFGAFVELAPGVDGLVHVSQISAERIGHASEVLSPGQEVEVRVLEIDAESHRISLTMRPEGEEAPAPRGGGSGGPRRAPRDRGPMEYTSKAEEPTEDVDVSGMEYGDALEALRNKFKS